MTRHIVFGPSEYGCTLKSSKLFTSLAAKQSTDPKDPNLTFSLWSSHGMAKVMESSADAYLGEKKNLQCFLLMVFFYEVGIAHAL